MVGCGRHRWRHRHHGHERSRCSRAPRPRHRRGRWTRGLPRLRRRRLRRRTYLNGAPYTGNIAKIEATDASTVVFTLCNPDPAFLPKVAFSPFAINDADYLIAHAPDQSIVDQPNGTGPFKLEEWRRGSEVIFAANPDYWGEAPMNSRSILRWSSQPGQKLIELQSGTVDGIDNPSVDDLDAIASDASLALIPREGLNIFYLGMNNTYEPFTNEKVRQAIAMGIDKQRIVDSFYSEGSSVADYFTPCSVPFACGGEPFAAFDPEGAKALLAEGLAELGLEAFPEVPISLRVVDRAYLPFPEQVAVDLQDQLQANLGITATIDVQESGTFIDNSDAGNLSGFHLLGWNADYPDPTNFLDYHFGPGASNQFGTGFDDIHAALVTGRLFGRSCRPRGGLRRGQHPSRPARAHGAHRPRRFVHGMARRCRGRALVATRQRGVRRGRAWRR